MTFTLGSHLSLLRTDKGLFPCSTKQPEFRKSQLDFREKASTSKYGQSLVEVTHRVWTSETDAHESTIILSGEMLWEFTFLDPPVHVKDPQRYLNEFVRSGAELLAPLAVLPKLEAYEQCGRRTHRAWALRWEPSRPDLNFVSEEFIPIMFFQKKFDYWFQIFAHCIPSTKNLDRISVVFTDIRGVIEIPDPDRFPSGEFFQGPLIVTFYAATLLPNFRGPYVAVKADCPSLEYILSTEAEQVETQQPPLAALSATSPAT